MENFFLCLWKLLNNIWKATKRKVPGGFTEMYVITVFDYPAFQHTSSYGDNLYLGARDKNEQNIGELPFLLIFL